MAIKVLLISLHFLHYLATCLWHRVVCIVAEPLSVTLIEICPNEYQKQLEFWIQFLASGTEGLKRGLDFSRDHP